MARLSWLNKYVGDANEGPDLRARHETEIDQDPLRLSLFQFFVRSVVGTGFDQRDGNAARPEQTDSIDQIRDLFRIGQVDIAVVYQDVFVRLDSIILSFACRSQNALVKPRPEYDTRDRCGLKTPSACRSMP